MIVWAAAASALIATGPDPAELERAARAVRRWMGANVGRVSRRALGTRVGVVVLTVVAPPVGIAVAGGSVIAGAVRRHRAARADAAVLAGQVPELVDLLRIGVAAGSNIEQVLRLIVRWVDEPMRSQLGTLSDRVDAGAGMADELDRLGRGHPEAQLVTSALAASLRYGMALDQTLAQIGFEVRTERRRRAEAHARKVPVKLLFPLVACSLPACGLLTIVPLVAGSIGSLPS